MSFGNNFRKILTDNVHGSSYITEKVIESFISGLKTNNNLSKNELKKTVTLIFNTFPNFTLLFHFLNELMLVADKNNEVDIPNKLPDFIENYLNKWNKTKEKAAAVFIENIDISSKNILLHSNSSAVQQVFETAKRNNINCTIWQTVSSPANEGILQAEKLTEYGFKVNLIHEDEIWLFSDSFDLILIGSDLITNRFFINKTGSHSISLLKKPVYIISESRKIINEKLLNKQLFDLLTSEKEKNPKELYAGDLKNIEPKNYYFEKVPYTNIKSIIIENDIINPDNLNNRFLSQNFRVNEIFY